MKHSRRYFLTAASVGILALLAPESQARMRMLFSIAPPPPPSDESIVPANIGSGGYIIGHTINQIDGALAAWCDTYSGFTYNRATNKWTYVVNPSNIGSALGGFLNTFNMAFDPQDSNYLYSWIADTGLAGVWNLFRSANAGGAWTSLGLTMAGTDLYLNINVWRQCQNLVAIDPFNSNCAYAGTIIHTPNNSLGLYYTQNVRAATPTWTRATGITDATTGPGYSVYYDESGGTTTRSGQTVCKRVWMVSGGIGAYLSTDGGVTWTQMSDGAGLGGPIDVGRMETIKTGPYAGTLYLTDTWVGFQNPTRVWQWTVGGGWVRPVYPVGYARAGTEVPGGQVAIDHANPGTVVFFSGFYNSAGFTTTRTTDNCVSFDHDVGMESQTSGCEWTTSGAGDVVFQEFCMPGGCPFTAEMSCANYDPLTPGRIFLSGGVGMWYTDYPTTFNGTPYVYNAMSEGLEQLIACNVIQSVGAPLPVCTVEDRGIVSPGTAGGYATGYFPGNYLAHADGGSDYASDDPSFMIGNVVAGSGAANVGYSTNYGQVGTWTTYPTQPAIISRGGWVASASVLNNIIVGGSSAEATITASMSGTTATITSVAGNILSAGQGITGVGVNELTKIVNQISPMSGKSGTYTVSVSQTVASTTITASGGATFQASISGTDMTVSAGSVSGVIGIGETLSGTGVTGGTTVTAQTVVPFNYEGTYTISVSQTVGSESMFVGMKLMYTLDGGSSWDVSSGITNDGWSQTFTQPRRALAADRVNIGTFYFLKGFGTAPGFYRSTDGGATWTLRATLASIYAGGMFNEYTVNSVPGQAGHVVVSQFTDTKARATNDGGLTWYEVGSNIGYTMPGATRFSYPRVVSTMGDYIAYSDNINVAFSGGTPTWTNMSQTRAALSNSSIGVRSIGVNMNDPSIFYLPTNGQGVFIGTLAA